MFTVRAKSVWLCTSLWLFHPQGCVHDLGSAVEGSAVFGAFAVISIMISEGLQCS